MYFTRRAGRSTHDFFVAGRSLPWFIAGTSIVATTFSSDTPLVVSGISRQSGIHGHWFWLSLATGQIATVFFFARLWRRTEATTYIEFITKRYAPSTATSLLRVFKVLFDGVLINCVVMGSVTLAMTKIVNALLGLGDAAIFHIPVLGDVSSATVVLLVLAATAHYCIRPFQGSTASSIPTSYSLLWRWRVPWAWRLTFMSMPPVTADC